MTWACERFSTYLLGKSFSVETDHKPLVPLLSNKHLDNLPPRILRFRLRLARFNFTIAHLQGKLLYTADALSRAPCSSGDKKSHELEEVVERFVAGVTSALPATERRLKEYCQAQERDPVCSRAAEYCQLGCMASKADY